tara:strand:+ start:267 stop:674 length:408 start_codon:yes stop_codon:yes gene_type:complete
LFVVRKYVPSSKCGLESSWRQWPIVSDQISGAFGYGYHGRVDVSTRHIWNYRSVNYPEVFDASHPEVWIDDGRFVTLCAHLTGAERVMDRPGGSTDKGVDLLASPAIGTGINLNTAKWIEGFLARDVSNHLEPGP